MSRHILTFQHDAYSYHCALIQDGIRRYFAQGSHRFSFQLLEFFEMCGPNSDTADLEVAMICWFQNSDNARQVHQMGIPFLNLCESETVSNVGLQITFAGEGHLAAKFFIEEMEFESLAYVGIEKCQSHTRRFLEFKKTAEAHKLNVNAHIFPSIFSQQANSPTLSANIELANKRFSTLVKLLREIPKPAGIFCADDRLALYLLHLAHKCGIRVPQDVSILGVGGVKRAEEGGVHEISVVKMDHVHQGYRAAQMMENWLNGEKSHKSLIISPDGILHRSTTFHRRTTDPLVQKAFDLIEQNRSINVNELSNCLNISRRTLHHHFISATNMGVAKTIDLERFRRAKQLIRSNRYNHEAIASLAGYRNQKQMIRSFERFVKMSPKQFSRSDLTPLR